METGGELLGAKDWNCDILMQRTTSMHHLIHEHLHARSIPYYDRDTYLKHRLVEESSVELLARIITKENGFKGDESFAYGPHVKDLESIYEKAFSGTMTKKEFAVEVFNQPLPNRLEWINNAAMKNTVEAGDWITYSEVYKRVKRLGVV
jgi:hypothetical protein